MTLVIAEKIKKNIALSSDSRISFGTDGYIDFGIKIFKIPVKIYSPTEVETNLTNLIYEHELGMAVIGSTVNAYTVKESIVEILQNLQYLPGHTDISMEGISNLVFKVYTKVVEDLRHILGKGGMCQVILAGYCGVENELRAFALTMELVDNVYRPTINEILNEQKMMFYGSGAQAGEKIKNENTEFKSLKIIKNVTHDPKITTVGGGLQYGEFDKSYNFKIFGVEDYELNPNGSFKDYKYTLRGIDLYKGDFEREIDGFHISYPMKRPFEQEINDALSDFL